MPLKEINSRVRQFITGDEIVIYSVIPVNIYKYIVVRYNIENGQTEVVHAGLNITDVEKLYNIKL
jgi:hypothetical protein